MGGDDVPEYTYPWVGRFAERSLPAGLHWVTQKLPQIYTANHATFPIRIRKITVQICGNFWVTQCKQLALLNKSSKKR